MTQRVAIICGGVSSEHEISCISGGSVYKAIDRSQYEPVLIGITKSGNWVLVPENHNLKIIDGVLPTIPEDAPAVVADVAGFSVGGVDLNIDIAFPVLHGPFGEDGTIQGFFEISGIPYVGSGVLASAVAMDKSFAKPIFAAHDMDVAEGFVISSAQRANGLSDEIKRASALGYPLFVKPARGGSSRGTVKVKREEDFLAAVDEALSFDTKAMVEKAIVGAEIECAVLNINGTIKASTVGQISIDPKFEFYDFESKYLDGATTILLPAPIDSSIATKIQGRAIEAFTALGCEGLARVDFFLTPSGDVIINELNTMPGFTSTSVFPKMWAQSGVEYSEIITYLLKSALNRTSSPRL